MLLWLRILVRNRDYNGRTHRDFEQLGGDYVELSRRYRDAQRIMLLAGLLTEALKGFGVEDPRDVDMMAVRAELAEALHRHPEHRLATGSGAALAALPNESG